MNDERLEKLLRDQPGPELPTAWRADILAAARREVKLTARPAPRRRFALVPWLRQVWLRNPVTTTALATLWMMIFLFRANTPVEPYNAQLYAHVDTSRPIELFPEQLLLARLEENEPAEPSVP